VTRKQHQNRIQNKTKQKNNKKKNERKKEKLLLIGDLKVKSTLGGLLELLLKLLGLGIFLPDRHTNQKMTPHESKSHNDEGTHHFPVSLHWQPAPTPRPILRWRTGVIFIVTEFLIREAGLLGQLAMNLLRLSVNVKCWLGGVVHVVVGLPRGLLGGGSLLN